MRTLLFLVFICFSSVVGAYETYRINDRIVTVDDTVGRLIEVAGKPDKIVPLVNKFNVQLAERYEYYRNGKTISFLIKSGRIVSIDEIS